MAGNVIQLHLTGKSQLTENGSWCIVTGETGFTHTRAGEKSAPGSVRNASARRRASELWQGYASNEAFSKGSPPIVNDESSDFFCRDC